MDSAGGRDTISGVIETATIDALRLPPPPEVLAFGAVKARFIDLVPGDPIRGLAPRFHFSVLGAGEVVVGHVNFRVGDSDHVRLYAGHIGYGIQEPFRGHGYARQACMAIAPFVRSIYETLIITCDPDNIASLKTIEGLGATFLEELSVPPHDPNYLTGSRVKRRYEWKP